MASLSDTSDSAAAGHLLPLLTSLPPPAWLFSSFYSFTFLFSVFTSILSKFSPDLFLHTAPPLLTVLFQSPGSLHPIHFIAPSLIWFHSSSPVISPPDRSPTSSQSVSAAVTVWTLTTRSASSACRVRVGRESRSSCLSSTAASAPAAKVGLNDCGPGGFACPSSTSDHLNICKSACMSHTRPVSVSGVFWGGKLGDRSH